MPVSNPISHFRSFRAHFAAPAKVLALQRDSLEIYAFVTIL
jgi:hypothetical protein